MLPNQRLAVLVAVFVMATGNASFVGRLLDLYPIGQGQSLFLLSVVLLFTAATAFMFNLFTYRGMMRWSLAAFLLVSSATAYFMDKYGTVLNTEMLVNMLQTNVSEASDLISVSMLFRILVLGVVPAVWLIRKAPPLAGRVETLRSMLLTAGLLIVVMAGCIAPFTSSYASFFRAHKTVRYYANPSYVTYSSVSLVKSLFQRPGDESVKPVAEDARLKESAEIAEHKELIVLVVGETARADRFALNGYTRPTNPNLEKEQILSFKNVSSCGTSTAVSVPCMFSNLTEAGFSVEKSATLENSLDVLKRNGVEVLWRDNNSDSKGVALRVDYQDFRNPENNPVCDPECRDVGMLHQLDDYINKRSNKDILIVLHQMGNHGPAYYKRYPKEFEFFKPVCTTNELSKCSQQEIDNAYDNAIRYTDYFLGEVIKLLKRHEQSHETAMLYVSDHGESLGEYGMYLHGAPKAFAPKSQTHVASLVWMGAGFDYSLADVKPYENAALSHDALFCSLLLAYELDSSACMQSRNALLSLHSDVRKSARASNSP